MYLFFSLICPRRSVSLPPFYAHIWRSVSLSLLYAHIWRSVHNPHHCRACACNLTVLTHSVGNGSGGLTSPRGTMTSKPWICPYMEICTQSTSLQGLCLEICLWTIHIYVLCPFYTHIWRSL